jgi:hypothetical protein
MAANDLPGNRAQVPPPDRRRLRAFAFDPMTTRLSGRYLNVDIPFEPDLKPGPMGELVHVVDYDSTRKHWYRPVDLNDQWILAEGGLRPSESDPRAHQQIVYAIAMSVIEQFERYLGRRFRWREDRVLFLVPHAFEGRNAFYCRKRRAVLFGYYRADEHDPGANLPGQIMFTCLSVDVIAHEVTHGIVHRLRRYYLESTNRDVRAWHEAFADLVALFHHFAYPEVVEYAISRARGDLRDRDKGGLLDLAREFGESIGMGHGRALRSAISLPVSPQEFNRTLEPHQRGAHFVAAVFDAYLETYQSRIADLLRIASGGTGVLPAGNLHPDLVTRVADEAVKNANRFLGMVIRSFDYLPVVDVNFGDVVRAIITADRQLYPLDKYHLRSVLVEALRKRGIHPKGIASLAEEALAWPEFKSVDANSKPLDLAECSSELSDIVLSATRDLDPSSEPGKVNYYFDENAEDFVSHSSDTSDERASEHIKKILVGWASKHAVELGLSPDDEFPILLQGLHVAYRLAGDRQPRPEIVLQFVQRREDLEESSRCLLPLRAGTTVIARADSTVNHVIAKPLPVPAAVLGRLDGDAHGMAANYSRMGEIRLQNVMNWLWTVEAEDPESAWTIESSMDRMSFSRLHAGQSDGWFS